MFSPINQTVVVAPPVSFNKAKLKRKSKSIENIRITKIQVATDKLEKTHGMANYYFNELSNDPKNALQNTANFAGVSEASCRATLIGAGVFVKGLTAEDKLLQPIFSLGEIAAELTDEHIASHVVEGIMSAPMALKRKLYLFKCMLEGQIYLDLCEVEEGRLTV